jgi:hypothetical protein
MKRIRICLVMVLDLLVISGAMWGPAPHHLASAARSHAPAALDVTWSVIGGGGGQSGAGVFRVEGTIGQAIAGEVAAAPYALCAGFWCASGGEAVYLPLVLRSS